MPSSGSPAPSPVFAFLHNPWTAALLIAVVTGLGYHHTLQVPFLMDDLPSIVDNPTIRHLGTAWNPPRDSGLTVSGRPLLNVSLALNYAISGLNPWSYHALNITIHAAAALLLYGIVRRTLVSGRCHSTLRQNASAFALATALLWAAHPLQTESVTYVVQRAESLVGFFYLLTFYGFIRTVTSPNPTPWRILTVFSCLAGMACKEVMATAPLLLLLFDRIYFAGSWREAWQRRHVLHVSLFASWILLGALIVSSGSRGGTVGFNSTISSVEYALTQTYAIPTYVRLAFWPVGLVFDYGVPQALSLSEIAPEFFAFLLLVGGTVFAAWRWPAAAFSALFFFCVLAPTSSFVPVATQTMTEHRMYVPLAGLVVLFASGLFRALPRQALTISLVLVALLSALTYQRNSLYRSDLALWEDTARKRPDNLRAHLNIGMIHYREGRYADAAAAYREVLALDPNMLEAANNLGNSLLQLGDYPEAAHHLEHALAVLEGRARAIALTNLGNVYLAAGQTDQAFARLQEAVILAPDLPDARYNYASALLRAGRALDALPHFEAALATRPDDHEIHGNYGNALLELGRNSDAIRAFSSVVRLRPDSAEAHNNLGVAYAIAGNPADAREYFRRAVELAPDFAPARENLARAERALQSPR